MQLSSPVNKISKVGPVYLKKLNKLGVKTIYDLFFHFPHRYDDFSVIKKIAETKIHETVCVKGKIILIENQATFRKRFTLTKVVVKDSTGIMQATWFNQPYLIQSLKLGDIVCLAGKIIVGKRGLYLSNPTYEKIWSTRELAHTGRIIPVYPSTKGLSSRWLRFILKPLLQEFKNQMPEPLPEELRRENKLLPIKKAIWEIHFPTSLKMAKKAKDRFAFEELFLLQLFVLNKKEKLSRLKTTSIPFNLEIIQKFVKSLPFKLTDAQRKSGWQILKDLEKTQPMTRLLQGDVGSGKTVVATLASLNALKANNQVAFMAPTEILAKQHFETLAHLLQDFNVNLGLLTSKTDKFISKKLKRQVIEISRTKLIEKTLEGEINILIGTHSLIQDKVKFHKLGLVIVDEQHRFGVEQRAKLCQKENNNKKENLIPHLLSMTATPIPRTLALTVYGDLDLSLIDEMPKGRRKVKTLLVSQKDREKTYQLIEKEIKKGRQIFIICPRIEERELEEGEEDKTGWSEVKAVKTEYERLAKKIFPQFKLAMLHGKIPSTEKSQIMKNFKNKKINILVSTSVIEVGIDIPNATVMIIEGAERFGLAQLHQFRGRIGRTGAQSYCFLFYNARSKNARARLTALVKINNGLELAEKDLKIRGPGQFLGTQQWGIPDIAMDVLDDFSLIETTREAAKKILANNSKLKDSPILKQRLLKFQKMIHLE